jgi:putative MATE family efflux protein
MMVVKTQNAQAGLGDSPIPALLLRLSLPSVFGLLALAVCQLVDTIFIGRVVGVSGIGAIAVVVPIILLFSSIGRGLGVGGASVVSRCLGKGLFGPANQTLSLLLLICFLSSLALLTVGLLFAEPLLRFFTGGGDIFGMSKSYYLFLLPGLPCLSLAMLSNSLIRSEGKARCAMLVLLIPAIVNVLLDPLFIIYCGWGMKGAAAASSIAYFCSASFGVYHFVSGRSVLQFDLTFAKGQWPRLKEALLIALTPVACQVFTALVAVVMSKTLFTFGGEVAMASYGIVQRLYMFILFPLIGICQGFITICGYNHGAGNAARVKELILYSVLAGSLVAMFISMSVLIFHDQLASIFTIDSELIRQSGFAIRTMVLLQPLVAVQLICSVYSQTLGHAVHSMLLTLLQQGLLLIPLVIILSHFFGVKGVWYAYPLANFIACAISLSIVFPQWQIFYGICGQWFVKTGPLESV